MVKPFLALRNYVVISTLVGTCLSAFQLYTLVPRAGDESYNLVDNSSDQSAQWEFLEKSKVNITIYGTGLDEKTIEQIYVSSDENCSQRDPLVIEDEPDITYMIHVSGTFPAREQDLYYICVREEGTQDTKALKFKMKSSGLNIPYAVRIVCALFLLCLSGLFSGLNLGLMSLDLTSLRILIETGNPTEKRYAKSIEPVRKQGNFLLCTLLLGNVLVNNTLTILLDGLFGGVMAVIGATAGIVVLGEIIPQAICQRFGLMVGARTLFITKMFMILTGPLSWPISKLLDLVLGEELGIFYRREQLKELLMLTEGQHGIHKDEVLMITGVLSINEKCVRDIMTDINGVYMLNIDVKLDFEVMQEIMSKGFSRIPVFEGDENHIVGLLFVKDLAFVDPDDELPLESVIKFYNHTAHKVLGDMKVLRLMQDFMTERYHMAIVNEIQEKEDFDPVYVPIGVVTLEDIIEEIIQQEIVDETDTYVTNDFKKKNEKIQIPLIPMDKKKDQHVMKISPQLQLATFTYLSTQIHEFSEENISANVLNKLLKQDVIKEVVPGDTPIIEAGKTCDFMAMILTGELKIEVGREKMVFVQGSFTTFCIPALVGPYVPDVTVLPSDVTCQYLCIHRDVYRRAIEATAMTAEERKDRPAHRPLHRPSADSQRSSPPAYEYDRKSKGSIQPVEESDNESSEVGVEITDPLLAPESVEVQLNRA